MNVTPQQLRRAADIQERIQALQAEVGRILGGEFSAPAAAAAPRSGKRHMSAAGRAAIAAAARARWAKIKAQSGGKAGTASSTTRKRTMSPAARRRLAELARARWAKARASGRRTL